MAASTALEADGTYREETSSTWDVEAVVLLGNMDQTLTWEGIFVGKGLEEEEE